MRAEATGETHLGDEDRMMPDQMAQGLVEIIQGCPLSFMAGQFLESSVPSICGKGFCLTISQPCNSHLRAERLWPCSLEWLLTQCYGLSMNPLSYPGF